MWIVAAVTSRPWFVQMFDVALLRRMCCSRACSVSVKPGLPSRSTVRPMMRPGIWRTCSMRVVMKPKYGPPEDSGTPSGWPSPTTMSTPFVPHSPGGFRMRERQRIHDRDDERAVRMRPIRDRIDVLEQAEEVRLLDRRPP